MIETNKLTNFTTIVLLLLKECRLERNVHQAVLAEEIAKAPSGINKIESGDTALQMEVFLSYCRALKISPSSVLATAERYFSLFLSNGWQITMQSIASNEDLLLKEAGAYYASTGYKKRIQYGWTALNGPIYYENGQVIGLDVFLFALYPHFKEKILNGIF